MTEGRTGELDSKLVTSGITEVSTEDSDNGGESSTGDDTITVLVKDGVITGSENGEEEIGISADVTITDEILRVGSTGGGVVT